MSASPSNGAAMVEALIGFGGNTGNVRETLRHAIADFCDGQAVRLLVRSADYRTPAWGLRNQPDFINLSIAAETTLTPRELLERALDIERKFGRDRSTEQVWGPRTLDIDLLTYGDRIIDDPWLQLPHPRILERAFVLVPLMEIRPQLVVRGVAIADALAQLDTSGIERLPTTD